MSKPLKIIFAGTPDFAAMSLQAILDARFEVPLVLTQPDRPSGRGMKLTPSPVKQVAISNNITVLQPNSLRLNGKYPEQATQAFEIIQHAQADVMVVAAYGLILPLHILNAPKHGCVNIHASLLPRFRGAAPIHRAILAGDQQSGITLMQMDEGLDTGAMLKIEQLAIEERETTGTLHQKLSRLGAEMIVEHLHQLQGHIHNNEAPYPVTPQPEEGITYAEKIHKAEARLDFNRHANDLDRMIRAFNPAPAAWTHIGDEMIKVWLGQPLLETPTQSAGTIVEVNKNGIYVACQNSVLCIQEIQRPGGKRLKIHQCLDLVKQWQGQSFVAA